MGRHWERDKVAVIYDCGSDEVGMIEITVLQSYIAYLLSCSYLV